MAVTNFFWDGDNLLQEYDDTGANVAHYVAEPTQYGNVISQRRGGDPSYCQFEAIGSTVEVTDSEGDVSDSSRYRAFGAFVEYAFGGEFPFAFVGRYGYYSDVELSQTYIRKRFYSPQIGRWASPDPLAIQQGKSTRYIYVQNNPMMRIDPSGLIDLIGDCDRPRPSNLIGVFCAASQRCTVKCSGFQFDFTLFCVPGYAITALIPTAGDLFQLGCCELGDKLNAAVCFRTALKQLLDLQPPPQIIRCYLL